MQRSAAGAEAEAHDPSPPDRSNHGVALTVCEPALLFVYGTLRRGSVNAMAQRLASEAEWIGPATMAGRLYAVSDYPAVVPSAEGVVTGDLFRLRDPASLGWLDVYEGCGADDPLPHEYARIEVRVTHDRTVYDAQAYVWNRPLKGLRAIDGGDWLIAMQVDQNGARPRSMARRRGHGAR